MDDLALIDHIFHREGIPLWGVCSFVDIADKLIECRAKSRLPENAVSVLCAAFPYFIPVADHNVSRYAIVPDYHTVVEGMLTKAAEELRRHFLAYHFEPFVDNSPIPEVLAAAKSGLGSIGKHGLLITEEYGSWVFLGEIITDLPLPIALRLETYCCGCGACVSACPAQAISLDGGIDKARCLSSITQQKKELTIEQQLLIRQSGCAWGCDICQEICPYNRDPKITPISMFMQEAQPVIESSALDQLHQRAFFWRGKKVMERNLALLQRQPPEPK